MLHTAETNHYSVDFTPTNQIKKIDSNLAFLNSGFNTLIKYLDRCQSSFEYSLNYHRGLESKHSVWDSKKYVQRYIHFHQQAERQSPSPDEVTNQLFHNIIQRDWETFLDEAVGWKTPAYPYSRFGLPDGYLEPIDQIGANFTKDRHNKGGISTRADIESHNMNRLAAWMHNETIQPGTRLIWISPRGSKAEGYPGESPRNPVMVNIYTKTDTETMFQQYKIWTPQAQLADLHRDLLSLGHELPQPDHSSLILDSKNSVISGLIELPPTVAFEPDEWLYREENTWEINRHDFPEIESKNFYSFRQQVLTKYLQYIEPVLHIALHQQAQLGESFWQSPELKSVLKELDLYFLTCTEATFKWVEDHDQRPTKTKKANKNQLTTATNLEYLEEKLSLQKQVLEGTQLSSFDIQELKRLNGILSVTNRAFSLSQCGILSPVSLLVKAPHSFSSSMELSTLSLSLKTELRSELQTYVKLNLPGAKEIWMVPADYLKAPGCHVITEGPDKGEVMGPCGLLLSDPRETLATTLADYLHVQQQLNQSATEDILENAVVNSNMSKADKIRARRLLHQLTKDLFKTSLSNLIAGVTELRAETAQTLPTQIVRVLQNSMNPLAELEFLIGSLATSRFVTNT